MGGAWTSDGAQLYEALAVRGDYTPTDAVWMFDPEGKRVYQDIDYGSRPKDTAPYRDLSLQQMSTWLTRSPEVEQIAEGGVPDEHLSVRVLHNEFYWNVEVRLEPADEEDAFDGAVVLRIVTGSIYAVPPVPKFCERFN